MKVHKASQNIQLLNNSRCYPIILCLFSTAQFSSPKLLSTIPCMCRVSLLRALQLTTTLVVYNDCVMPIHVNIAFPGTNRRLLTQTFNHQRLLSPQQARRPLHPRQLPHRQTCSSSVSFSWLARPYPRPSFCRILMACGADL